MLEQLMPTDQQTDARPMNRRRLGGLVVYVILLLLVTRGLFLFTGYLGKNLFSDFTAPTAYQEASKGELNMKLPSTLHETRRIGLGDLAKYDTNWYFGIVRDGYLKADIHRPHPRANWVFFPLYPASLRMLSKVLPVDLTLLSLVFSNAMFAAALGYLVLLLRQRGFLESQIKATLLFLALYPTSFYFSLPYTESMFLMLSAACIYYSYDRQYFLAFLAAGLSTVTRPPGMLNILLTCGLMVTDPQIRFRVKATKLPSYAVISLIPLGIFLAYMQHRTGSYLAPFKEQYISWYKVSCIPFTSYFNYCRSRYFLSPGGWNEGLTSFLMTTVVLVTFTAYFLRNFRKLVSNIREFGFFLYGFALIAMPFATTDVYMVSVVRYEMVSIPFFVYLGELTAKSESTRNLVTIGFTLLLTIFTIAFFNNYYFIV